jgi:hypothetical protein
VAYETHVKSDYKLSCKGISNGALVNWSPHWPIEAGCGCSLSFRTLEPDNKAPQSRNEDHNHLGMIIIPKPVDNMFRLRCLPLKKASLSSAALASLRALEVSIRASRRPYFFDKLTVANFCKSAITLAITLAAIYVTYPSMAPGDHILDLTSDFRKSSLLLLPRWRHSFITC